MDKRHYVNGGRIGVTTNKIPSCKGHRKGKTIKNGKFIKTWMKEIVA